MNSAFNKDWYGDQAKIIKQEADCMTIDYGCRGKGLVTNYMLFDGIQLSFLDFETDITMPSQRFNPDIISITHCRFGRYECEYANHIVSYLPEGYFSVTGTEYLLVSFSFPLKKYYGLSLVIDKQALSESVRRMMETIPLNLDQLGSTLGIEKKGYFKIKALELLYHIDQLTQNHGCDFKYYDKGQIQTAKEIQKCMITHLDERVSLEKLTAQYQINLSLFHKIFLQIYGAAAFQSVYGVLPKDYRKQK